MIADESVVKKVLMFVMRETDAQRDVVAHSVDLFRELGMEGDDAFDFMQKFSQEFGVSMEGFEPRRYFGPEAAFNPIAVLFPQWWKMRCNIRPITLARLVAVVSEGRWKD